MKSLNIFYLFTNLEFGNLCIDNKVLFDLQKSLEEAEQMKRERSRIISSMSNVKRTVAEIQLHEEELVREVNFALN